MDDDEEMKNQCFGGEYMGEVFDHVVKRMSYRRQKRWWNAYILFYTKEETVDVSGPNWFPPIASSFFFKFSPPLFYWGRLHGLILLECGCL